MKALFKNKKLMTGVIAVMVGVTILLAGLTMAWFTSSGTGPTTNSVSAGVLRVSADLGLLEQNMVPIYPGDLIPGVGRLNAEVSGRVGALSRLDLSAVVTLADGSWSGETDIITIAFNPDGYDDPYGDTGLKAYPLGCWFNSVTETMALWQKGLDGRIYVVVWGNTDDGGAHGSPLHFAYDVFFDGAKNFAHPVDNNLLQGCTVEASVAWLSTQNLPLAAITDVFPYITDPTVYFEDFMYFDTAIGMDVPVFFEFDGSNPLNPGISPFGAGGPSSKVAKFLDGIEDGFWKDKLINIIYG